MLEEGNYTLTWSEDDPTALRLIEVVYFDRSGRSSPKSNSSRAELRLGNNALRDPRGFGSCFGAREWYRGFGIWLARKSRQNLEREKSLNKRKWLNSSSIYRLRVWDYAGRNLKLRRAYSVRGAYSVTRGVLWRHCMRRSVALEYWSDKLHPTEYAGRTQLRGA